MAKKYVIKSFKPGEKTHNHINPLINLSALGINSNTDIIKTSLSLSASQTQETGLEDQYYPNFYDAMGNNKFSIFKDLTKNPTKSYAFYNLSYS